MITAPYNFVPLNKKVVEAYWADQISHDKPFKEFQSGTLEVEMTAENPIYIRNGGKTIFITNNKGEKEEIPDPEFNNFNGRYFIPGSSIKGMLRSVVEIMSFGKLEDKVNDVRLSLRDFQNNFLYPKSDLSKESQAGWLRFDGVSYYLKPCGRPGRIKHVDLDVLTRQKPISKYYQDSRNVSNDKQKSAKSKYELFQITNETLTFSEEGEEDGIGRKKFLIDANGPYKGKIVFTGQPSVRKEPNRGKQYEFIFFERDYEEIKISNDDPEFQIIKNFFFAYYDHDRNQQKEDWKWRKKQLTSGESIPVFFRLKDQNKPVSKPNIKDIGLSLLYKITYNKSIVESIRSSQDNVKRDLSETIFGYTVGDKEKKEQSLKGRVWISHAFAEGNPVSLGLKLEVLAGPKPTYYPNYIKQNETNGKVVGRYSTFMDKESEIRGYKRYPVRFAEEIATNPPPKNERTGEINEKVATRFKPLDKGTKFKFLITYHNLKKTELGALISAITFHLNDGYSHSIGMGKSLGYGRVNLRIVNKTLEELKPLSSEFEAFMNWSLGLPGLNWHQSEQIKALFTLSKPFPGLNSKLKFMAKPADFAAAKGKKKEDPKYALQKYTDIVGQSIEINSLLSIESLNKFFQRFEDDKIQSQSLSDNDPGSEWVEFYLNKLKGEVNSLINEKKGKLIEEIHRLQNENERLKAEMLIEKAKAIDEENRKKQMEAGLDLSSVKINSRAFDEISKKVNQYIKKLPNELLTREDDIATLKLKVIEVLEKFTQKELDKWNGRPLESNPYYQKIARWVGEESAESFF
ncbi:TIGR03986 family type III CRISPR-associated RAMP protein [Algoriphagus formosus]|uniref:TIGR03986 family type III CRISPR-associated RAMP protein n=1 Tax=Algoriphagus formosus TaxID=2007308 RepID=UPI000C2912C7|nr:TIGR03986 family CRISPR-associated RAMP protein [Algoriphagus formosus]